MRKEGRGGWGIGRGRQGRSRRCRCPRRRRPPPRWLTTPSSHPPPWDPDLVQGDNCDLLKTNGDWLKQMEVIMCLGDTLTWMENLFSCRTSRIWRTLMLPTLCWDPASWSWNVFSLTPTRKGFEAMVWSCPPPSTWTPPPSTWTPPPSTSDWQSPSCPSWQSLFSNWLILSVGNMIKLFLLFSPTPAYFVVPVFLFKKLCATLLPSHTSIGPGQRQFDSDGFIWHVSIHITLKYSFLLWIDQDYCGECSIGKCSMFP